MTRHIFYVVNLETGEVKGSNNVEAVESVIDDDNYVVIHKDSGAYFNGSREEVDIESIPDGEIDDEE